MSGEHDGHIDDEQEDTLALSKVMFDTLLDHHPKHQKLVARVRSFINFLNDPKVKKYDARQFRDTVKYLAEQMGKEL